MTNQKKLLRGKLDLLVLKTLDTLWPLREFGIARRIEEISGDLLYLNQGTLYPTLLRLQQKGWIMSKWWGLREQPALPLLFADQGRARAANRTDRELGTDGSHYHALIARRRRGAR